MTRYAADTSVSVDRSVAEIRATVQRYGATAFMQAEQDTRAMIGFVAHGRRVQFVLQMPDRGENRFWTTPGGRRRRTETDAYKAWEQACRASWRALALVVKAKLEAVETGITTFEQEFLAHIVLPDGRTVGDVVLPSIEVAYTTGTVPALLPAWEGKHGRVS